MGCKALSKNEIVVKTLALIEALEKKGDSQAIQTIADKCGVTWREVYRWSGYMQGDKYPEPENKKKLLRLYNYHCRDHKGDRKPKKGQDEIPAHPPEDPTEPTTRFKNPVSISSEKDDSGYSIMK